MPSSVVTLSAVVFYVGPAESAVKSPDPTISSDAPRMEDENMAEVLKALAKSMEELRTLDTAAPGLDPSSDSIEALMKELKVPFLRRYCAAVFVSLCVQISDTLYRSVEYGWWTVWGGRPRP